MARVTLRIVADTVEAHPNVLFVNGDQTVTWTAENKPFPVQFLNGSPFDDGIVNQ